jgi:hypothetical protein
MSGVHMKYCAVPSVNSRVLEVADEGRKDRDDVLGNASPSTSSTGELQVSVRMIELKIARTVRVVARRQGR